MRPASVIGKSIQKPRPAALPGNAGAGVSLGSPRRSSTALLLEPHFTHRADVEYRNFTLREQTAWAWSEGGAYVHNLFAGEISTHSDDDRMTPFHRAHSTAIAGLHKIPGGDDRYYHNVSVQRGDLSPYDTAK
ncbi:MAG: hypothetical protein NT154_42750, partial [Verrucomicrobia bacterium]|nr:hypothetical protein [Verrucomicrobiota bacterium]